jgi:hypothetical protein
MLLPSVRAAVWRVADSFSHAAESTVSTRPKSIGFCISHPRVRRSDVDRRRRYGQVNATTELIDAAKAMSASVALTAPLAFTLPHQRQATQPMR